MPSPRELSRIPQQERQPRPLLPMGLPRGGPQLGKNLLLRNPPGSRLGVLLQKAPLQVGKLAMQKQA